MTDKSTLLQQVENALGDIRPHLAADGGDVQIVEITDDMTVRIKWMGNCENCSMSFMTMRAGIEHAIKSKVPGILQVEAINGIGVA